MPAKYVIIITTKDAKTNMQPPRYYNSRRAAAVATRPPHRHFKRWHIVVALAVLVVASGVFAQQRAIAAQQKAAIAAEEARQQRHAAAIQRIIATDTHDAISVAVRNVATGETEIFGRTSAFPIASTEKILSALLYYHLVETDRARLDAKLGAYSASFQLKTMINISNNDAWYLINDAAGGNAALQAYANRIGIPYQVNGNLMTASAMTLLLAKLYQGDILSGIHTRELLSYMQHTNEESMLPAVVSAPLTLYHKYGELDDTLHDVGLVTDGTAAYAIAIYTKGTSSRAERVATVQQISKEIIALCGW